MFFVSRVTSFQCANNKLKTTIKMVFLFYIILSIEYIDIFYEKMSWWLKLYGEQSTLWVTKKYIDALYIEVFLVFFYVIIIGLRSFWARMQSLVFFCFRWERKIKLCTQQDNLLAYEKQKMKREKWSEILSINESTEFGFTIFCNA